ncbi:MAG: HD domain-containing phosphohydrolase [Pseudomonadota bacterium]
MSGTSLSTTVNTHFLNRLLAMCETTVVGTGEDVIDAQGRRLLARGTRLSEAHRPLLLQQTLRKPLEGALLVPSAIDSDDILSCATRILHGSEPLGRILRASGGQGASPLALVAAMQFGQPMRMLLTLASHQDPQALDHCVTVSLLAICMAKKLHLSDDEQLAAGTAGLLHDIGELYIDPRWLAAGKRLLPHEWAHLVVHPRIGQLLINELESFPLSVGRAVAEHHERFDGTGYPRQIMGNNISAPGQALSVAEMIAGVLHKDHPLERAELALKVVPGEHARELLSAVSGALRTQDKQACAASDDVEDDQGVERLFWRISSALESGQNLLDGSAASPRARTLLARALERIESVQRAFIGTGLDAYLNHNHGLHNDADPALLFEKTVATREIRWRLRDIARDLALHTAASPDEKTVFACLINLLDDDPGTELKPQRKAVPLPALAALAPASFAGSQPYAT